MPNRNFPHPQALLPWLAIYCHTFEKRSSLPPTGLADPDPVVGPVLLAHPPNSSSAATFGAALKPPDAPGTIGVLANDPEEPHPPKSPLPPKTGFGASAGLAGAGAAAAVFVSGVLQALAPQTSEFDQFPEPMAVVADAVGLAAGGGDLVWFERLKTELEAGVGEGLLGGAAG